jgi:prepilin-type processing-associated H-X9-DG protein
MKPRISKKLRAFTIIELLMVAVALLMLAGLALVVLAAAKRRSAKIGCVSCIKQVNLAFRIWEGDNGNLYPMAVSTSIGGGREFIQTGNPTGCFQVVSNEISTPKILACPNDLDRTYAFDLASLNRTNISYFLGVDVTNDSNPNLILDGDDNLELNNSRVSPGLLSLPTNAPVGWAPGRHDIPTCIPFTDIPVRHNWCGNIGFADGSVSEESPDGLKNAFISTGVATNRLAIP